MIERLFRYGAVGALLTAACLAAPPGPAAACMAAPTLGTIEAVLTRAAERVARDEKLTIVAVGSSSTSGVGATAPALSYPSRLEAELKDRFPHLDIRVVNRGKGGEDVAEEVARLSADVIGERPDLVIWQLGTNAVLRRDDLASDGVLMQRGIAMLKEHGIDVVLMDLQYAPRVLERPGYATMEQLIADIAERTEVGLFRRFTLMQYWQMTRAGDGPALIGGDGLHMTDASYGCLAKTLAGALASNWKLHNPAPVGVGDAVADLREVPGTMPASGR